MIAVISNICALASIFCGKCLFFGQCFAYVPMPSVCVYVLM